MQYAQLNKDGTYSHQITTNGNVEWDATHYCPASALTEDEARQFRVTPLVETEPPAFNLITQSVIRDGGELVNGQWQYKWRIDALYATQVEADAAVAAYAEANRRAAIPQSVTMRQARLALLATGKLAAVNSAIAGMTGEQGEAARIEWEFSGIVSRTQPLVLALGALLGLTDAQMDELFIAARVL